MKSLYFYFAMLIAIGCQMPKMVIKNPEKTLPNQFTLKKVDSTSIATINWREFFGDEYLAALIDTALIHNQELNILAQDIELTKSELLEKKGDYMPKVGLGAGIGTSKLSNNTRDGQLDKIIEKNELKNPDLDLGIGAQMAWEIDIWKQLRNAKNAAEIRVIASNEGKNLAISRLVAEIAHTYYELMALDNSILILDENIGIQKEAYEKMKWLKEYAKANQLAVNRFEAQLLNTQTKKFQINQTIKEKENYIQFLTGKINPNIPRHSYQLMTMEVKELAIGIPSQLIENRPDIRRAEQIVKASQYDLKAAKANFYPKLSLKAGIGFSAFDPSVLLHPESIIYNLAGDLMAPVLNRNAFFAKYNAANALQNQAIYEYQQKVIIAYTEVLNQINKLENAQNSFKTKEKEVTLLNESVEIANSLFQYAKADYIEVLLTQKEHLNAEMELIDYKLDVIQSKIGLYQSLGGGWH
ncbi:MAG: TolC family protein [Chitinophagales bacterium]|nr:TolC family protein [Chitinophagales bacterium]